MSSKKCKVILFGKDGQIGSALLKTLRQDNVIEVISFGRQEVNFENYKIIEDVLLEHKPDIVINAVAFTDVENANAQCEIVDTVNHQAVKQLAISSRKINALLIHFSSDFIFDGTKVSSYSEMDHPNPLNYYGQSKLNGDLAIQEHSSKYLIFRCSWVYSFSSNNFPNRLLKKSLSQEKLFVVDDTWGGPTSAFLIANVVKKILLNYCLNPNLESIPYGVYNIAAQGKTTWFTFSKLMFDRLKKKNFLEFYPKIMPISSDSYHSNVQRPKNSTLDLSKLLQEIELDIPDWETDLEEWVEEFTKKFNIKSLKAQYENKIFTNT